MSTCIDRQFRGSHHLTLVWGLVIANVIGAAICFIFEAAGWIYEAALFPLAIAIPTPSSPSPTSASMRWLTGPR